MLVGGRSGQRARERMEGRDIAAEMSTSQKAQGAESPVERYS